MDIADHIVDRSVGEYNNEHVPARVKEIIERHRQALLGLANALLVAGRDEDEVVQVIQKASESFAIKLKSETEGLQS